MAQLVHAQHLFELDLFHPSHFGDVYLVLTWRSNLFISILSPARIKSAWLERVNQFIRCASSLRHTLALALEMCDIELCRLV